MRVVFVSFFFLVSLVHSQAQDPMFFLSLPDNEPIVVGEEFDIILNGLLTNPFDFKGSISIDLEICADPSKFEYVGVVSSQIMVNEVMNSQQCNSGPSVNITGSVQPTFRYDNLTTLTFRPLKTGSCDIELKTNIIETEVTGQTINVAEMVPTMSQWSLFMLGLLLSCGALISIGHQSCQYDHGK